MVRESARSIETSALEWVVRIDRKLTVEENSELDAWLAGDARRSGALARAQAAWVHVERARVVHPHDALSDVRIARRSWLPTWAAAAAVLSCVLVGGVAWQRHSWTQVNTAVGELRHIQLEDGSTVTLDTKSHVSVRYEPDVRHVRLDSGEALFEVAKDSHRPFVVEVGSARVKAVGTAFVIRRQTDETAEVTVTKGVVEVWDDASPNTPVIRLASGNQTRITSTAIEPPVELSHSQLSGAVSWSTGILDLNGRTLGEAAEELNRYNRLQIVIDDPDVASQPVVGRFRTNDPTAFVNAAAAMLGARIETDGNRLLLVRSDADKK